MVNYCNAEKVQKLGR